MKKISQLEARVQQWTEAGLIDAQAAASILAFEAGQERRASLRGPVLLAMAFGGMLFAAGAILFVAAHWDVAFTYTPSAEGSTRSGYRSHGNRSWAHSEIRNGELIAQPPGSDSGEWVLLRENTDGTITAVSEEPVALFIPENAKAPVLKRGEELWIEVTVPRKGPPRRIQIGIRRDTYLARA